LRETNIAFRVRVPAWPCQQEKAFQEAQVSLLNPSKTETETLERQMEGEGSCQLTASPVTYSSWGLQRDPHRAASGLGSHSPASLTLGRKVVGLKTETRSREGEAWGLGWDWGFL
jgi:hypothetical protein